MHGQGVGAILISALDEVAWLYNIRGGDVEFNPVVIAYSGKKPLGKRQKKTRRRRNPAYNSVVLSLSKESKDGWMGVGVYIDLRKKIQCVTSLVHLFIHSFIHLHGPDCRSGDRNGRVFVC